MIISDGHIVNGSKLIIALAEKGDKKNAITGGLAGDRPHFQSTLVGLNKAPSIGNIV